MHDRGTKLVTDANGYLRVTNPELKRTAASVVSDLRSDRAIAVSPGRRIDTIFPGLMSTFKSS